MYLNQCIHMCVNRKIFLCVCVFVRVLFSWILCAWLCVMIHVQWRVLWNACGMLVDVRGVSHACHAMSCSATCHVMDCVSCIAT